MCVDVNGLVELRRHEKRTYDDTNKQNQDSRIKSEENEGYDKKKGGVGVGGRREHVWGGRALQPFRKDLQ